MLDYRRDVFLAGRGTTAAMRAVAALSCALLFVAPSAGAAVASNTSVVPADGRLNTANFTATVTSVAWPATNGGTEPTPGRRFVRFTLVVSAPGRSVSPTSPTPSLSAALRWDSASHPLSLSSVDDQLQGGSGSSASASYVASVPNNTHQVHLVLSQGSFSQSFDLWNLRRVPPAPSVLYRDANGTTLSGTSAGSAMLALSNPGDGFTSSASVTLQSATLGYFAPSGTTLSPGPDQGVLSVVLDAEFPNDPADPTGSGHYLGSTTPLPTNLLSFTPSGGTAVSATMSDAGDTTGKGTSDDGLFDATYSFVVPASLTTGSLEVDAGSFSGAEFTLYTAESGEYHPRRQCADDPRPQLSGPGGAGEPVEAALGRGAESSDERGLFERLCLAGRGQFGAPRRLPDLGGDRDPVRRSRPRRARRALASEPEVLPHLRDDARVRCRRATVACASHRSSARPRPLRHRHPNPP